MTGRTLSIRVSFDGVLGRIANQKGGSPSNDQKFMLKEIVRHYGIAKQAWIDGDKEVVDSFFDLYTHSDEIPKKKES